MTKPCSSVGAASGEGLVALFPPDVTASLMRRALFLAESNLGATSPNPSVGAVIADRETGEIIASAVTAQGGRPHAEAQALAKAGSRALGAIMVVTLEPCSHFGATPPCAHAIAEAGIAAVIYGSRDPDMRVSGRGLTWLSEHGVAVMQGPFAREADWLNLGHALRVTARRPFVQIKLAVDAHGRVPKGAGGRPQWVTGDAARAQAHLLRARADAILVGRKTVEADDPELTCRLPGLDERSPIRVVLAPRGDLPYEARLFNAERPPTWIVCGVSPKCGRLFGRSNVRFFDIGVSSSGVLNLQLAMNRLAAEGVTRLLVEGGPSTSRRFLDAQLADEIVIMQSDKSLEHEGSLPAFVDRGLDIVTESPSFALTERRKAGADAILIFRSTAHWQKLEPAPLIHQT